MKYILKNPSFLQKSAVCRKGYRLHWLVHDCLNLISSYSEQYKQFQKLLFPSYIASLVFKRKTVCTFFVYGKVNL